MVVPDAVTVVVAVFDSVIKRTVFGKSAWSHHQAFTERCGEEIERLSLRGLLC